MSSQCLKIDLRDPQVIERYSEKNCYICGRNVGHIPAHHPCFIGYDFIILTRDGLFLMPITSRHLVTMQNNINNQPITSSKTTPASTITSTNTSSTIQNVQYLKNKILNDSLPSCSDNKLSTNANPGTSNANPGTSNANPGTSNQLSKQKIKTNRDNMTMKPKKCNKKSDASLKRKRNNVQPNNKTKKNDTDVPCPISWTQTLVSTMCLLYENRITENKGDDIINIFKKVSTDLMHVGCEFIKPDLIAAKMRYLVKKYRSLKSICGETGEMRRKNWIHYEALNSFLGDKPESRAAAIVSSLEGYRLNVGDSCSETDSCSEEDGEDFRTGEEEVDLSVDDNPDVETRSNHEPIHAEAPSVGSLVQVKLNNCTVYGVIRWIGIVPELNSDVELAGVELESRITGGSDGSILGRKIFDSEDGCTIFVRLSICATDERFREMEQEVNMLDCNTSSASKKRKRSSTFQEKIAEHAAREKLRASKQREILQRAKRHESAKSSQQVTVSAISDAVETIGRQGETRLRMLLEYLDKKSSVNEKK